MTCSQLGVQDFLKHWDILCFVEAAIYKIDEENELLASSCSNHEHTFEGLSRSAPCVQSCIQICLSLLAY